MRTSSNDPYEPSETASGHGAPPRTPQRAEKRGGSTVHRTSALLLEGWRARRGVPRAQTPHIALRTPGVDVDGPEARARTALVPGRERPAHYPTPDVHRPGLGAQAAPCAQLRGLPRSAAIIWPSD